MLSFLICVFMAILIIISNYGIAADKELQCKNKELKKRIRHYEILEYPLCFTCTTKSCQYNQAYDAKEHLANMEKMLQECESDRRKPKDGEKYWYVTNSNQVSQTNFTSERSYKREDDYQRWLTYNYFQTREQAELEVEKILVRRILEDIARRLNKGQKFDWYNSRQLKHCITLCHDNITTSPNFIYKTQGTIYCLDKNFKDIAIREIGEERLKKYLRGE